MSNITNTNIENAIANSISQASDNGSDQNAQNTTNDTNIDIASVGNEQNATTTNSAVTATDTNADNDFNAIKGKVSTLEKERNEYSKKAKELEDARYRDYLSMVYDANGQTSPEGVKILDKNLRSDPSTYEWFRAAHKKNTGEDLGDYSYRYGQNQGQQYNTTPSNIDPVSIKNEVKQEIRQEFEEEQALTKFIQSRPKVAEIYQQDREQGMDMFTKVYTVAKSYAVTGMPLDQAMTVAFDTITGNLNNVIENAKQQGELLGRGNALASTGSSGFSSGTSANVNSTGPNLKNLTPAQVEKYNSLIKTKGKQYADRYASYAGK